MKRTAVLILFSILFQTALSASTSAEVFERDWKSPGDGLLTYDDVNRREWLDLTETQLFKFPGDTLLEQYQAVLAETAFGGRFSGFTVAAESDVSAFANSAGINTYSLDFDVNHAAASVLIDLMSPTLVSGGNRVADGAVTGLDPGQTAMQVAFGPFGRSNAFAGVQHVSVNGSTGGVWLYRAVPEPSGSLLMFTSLVLFSANIRFCHSRMR